MNINPNDIETRQRPRYTLDELLAQCDPHAPITEHDLEWINIKPVGGELYSSG